MGSSVLDLIVRALELAFAAGALVAYIRARLDAMALQLDRHEHELRSLRREVRRRTYVLAARLSNGLPTEAVAVPVVRGYSSSAGMPQASLPVSDGSPRCEGSPPAPTGSVPS